jgi:hypothetical protein
LNRRSHSAVRLWRAIRAAFRACGPLLLLALTLALPLAAQGPSEYQVKAAFLYNFAKFVEWPADAPGQPFCIGILGADPFGPLIDETLNGKTLGGRGVVVRRFSRPEDALACQIVFVAISAAPLKPLLKRFENRSVLTVGEAPAFCQSGGIIGLEVSDQRIRFAVNREAADRAQLKLSSKLLSLATRIWGERR